MIFSESVSWIKMALYRNITLFYQHCHFHLAYLINHGKWVVCSHTHTYCNTGGDKQYWSHMVNVWNTKTDKKQLGFRSIFNIKKQYSKNIIHMHCSIWSKYTDRAASKGDSISCYGKACNKKVLHHSVVFQVIGYVMANLCRWWFDPPLNLSPSSYVACC